MLQIGLQLSVIFVLNYNVVTAAPSSSNTSGPDDFGAAVLNRRTFLKPYLTEFDAFYAAPGKYQKQGRRVLSATPKHIMTDPFTKDKWMEIENWSPTPCEYDDEGSKSNYAVVYNNIYNDVLNILLSNIYKWVNYGGTLESALQNYLGFKEQTVNVINMAMTELFSQQRKRLIKIDSLAQIFYYSCDVLHMVDENTNLIDYDMVKRRFEYFITKFEQIVDFGKIIRLDEITLVTNIKLNLRSIEEKTEASFGVTIPAMKMRILMDRAHDGHMKLIQNRRASPQEESDISEYVHKYRNKYDGNKVNAYHLKILGVVTTHVFGYVRNHFDLLSKLRQHGVDLNDKSVIDRFAKFINAYTAVFIDRYFEFKGEINQQLVDALFPLIYFLDPSDPQTPDIKGLEEGERSTLNEHEKPKFSMDQYFINPKGDDEFDQYMLELVDKAVEILIATFTEDDTYSWNSLLKIEYKTPINRESLLQHMTTNSENAINILGKFANEFTIDQRLYDYYDLNDTSSSPINIHYFES